MTAPELVVFDLDGVLVDTRHVHFQALDQALEACGHQPLTRERHLELDGLPTATKLAALGITDPLVPARKQEFTRSLLKALPVDESKREMVERLRDAGWRVGVASNAVRDTVDLCLRALGLDVEFSLSNEDVTNPKPSPEIYLRACSLAGVAPWRAVVVEDRDRGVEAALAAGCYVLQVADPDEVTRERCDPDGWPWAKVRGGGLFDPEAVHQHRRQADGRPRPVVSP